MDETQQLLEVIKTQNIPKLLLLISGNIDISSINLAIIYDNTYCSLDIIKLLVDKGVDINSKDDIGSTVLHFASRKANMELIRYLLKNSVDINSENSYGLRAISYAIMSGHYYLTEFLILSGSEINFTDEDGCTPLMTSIGMRKDFIEQIDIEIDKNKSIIKKLILPPLLETILKNQIHIAELLIRHNADINIVNIRGETAYSLAIESNNSEVVRLLEKQCKNIG